jgi:hypothetical protein
MIDKNKVYKTRDGREVRIYATDGGGPKKPIHGAVKDKDGWYMLAWSKNGIVSSIDKNLDLIEDRPRHKRTVWLNMYKTIGQQTSHHSRKQADEERDSECLACIKVELDFEEGDGL